MCPLVPIPSRRDGSPELWPQPAQTGAGGLVASRRLPVYKDFSLTRIMLNNFFFSLELILSLEKYANERAYKSEFILKVKPAKHDK